MTDSLPSDFAELQVATFLEQLGSASPTPGGGTGAALAGAMGAALVQMQAELTLGREKYAQHEPLMQAIVAQAKEERATLLELAKKDAEVYGAVGAAYKLPKATEDEKTARRAAIQQALKDACEVPLETMHHCLEVIGLAKNVVTSGNKNAASDGAAGAELARAGLKVAGYNVKINLVSIKDTAYVDASRARMDEMAYMGMSVANQIDSKANELWQIDPA